VAHYRAANWKEALVALEKSLELRQGGNSSDWFFLAMAHWQRGDREQARRWYAPAVLWMEQHRPKDEELRRFRAEAAGLLGLPEQSPPALPPAQHDDVEIYTLVLKADPGAGWAYRQRGLALAEREQWGQAAEDFSKVVELKPDDPWDCYHCAVLRLQPGDTAGYRRLCASMQERFGRTAAREPINLLAWTCVLGPGAIADLLPILQLAEKNSAGNPSNWYYRTTLGAAYYRAGQFETAIGQMGEASKVHGNGGNAFNWLFLAMAHQRLGHADEARQWLAKAASWIEQAAPGKLKDYYITVPLPWLYRLQLQLLHREAEALVNGPANDPPPAPGNEGTPPKE
jgi:tetratricopeptide (TPR) repeat protein